MLTQGESGVIFGVECDQCHTEQDITVPSTRTRSLRRLKAAGWWIGREGDALCPKCADEIIHLVEDRQGFPGYCPPPGRNLEAGPD